MINIEEIALENIRNGYFIVNVRGRRSIDILKSAARAWKIDPEEANLAIIEGNKKRAERALQNVAIGNYNCLSPEDITYREEITLGIKRKAITIEQAADAFHNGICSRIEIVIRAIAKGKADLSYAENMTYRKELKEFVDKDYVEPEDANIALAIGHYNRKKQK
jgi:hypothetical protein